MRFLGVKLCAYFRAHQRKSKIFINYTYSRYPVAQQRRSHLIIRENPGSLLKNFNHKPKVRRSQKPQKIFRQNKKAEYKMYKRAQKFLKNL